MKQAPLFAAPTVEEKKDAMLDRIAASVGDDEEKRAELDWVLNAIEKLARTGVKFTATAVRERTGDLAYPNVVGMGFHLAAKRRWIRAVGYMASESPKRHGAVVRVWQGIARVR